MHRTTPQFWERLNKLPDPVQKVAIKNFRLHITAELYEPGELIGVEILNVTSFLRDSIMESVQFKVLQGPVHQAP